MLDELSQRFTIVHEVTCTIPGAELDRGTSQERYRAWRAWLRDQGVRYPVERLLPRVVRDDIVYEWPTWARPRANCDRSPAELRRDAFAFGPWIEPFQVGAASELPTQDSPTSRLLFRRALITETVARVLGDDLRQSTVIDIGCHNGFFSFDLAARGAKHVQGVDLRPANIAQAQFLHGVYGSFDNLAFAVADVNDLDETQLDVVMLLGVLYHVTDPVQLMIRIHAMTRRVAVIDLVCNPDPVSLFVFLADKDTSIGSEGRDIVELHPTYRATIDLIRNVGFTEIVEITGSADPPHPYYENGFARCFLAFK